MQHRRRWIAGSVIVAALLMSACASVGEQEGSAGTEPGTLEPIEGSDVPAVVLTSRAAERLDIQADTVRQAGGSETEIPYAAVFYTADGSTWTYTNPEPLTFVRSPIVVDHFEGDRVFLSDGPPVGTSVVTRGAAELFGTETGVEE